MGVADLESVLRTVRERIEPSADEREALDTAIGTVVERAEAALADRDVDGDVRLVGSTTRDTWLAGERDVDVFVRFPPDLPREDLEAIGLEIGHAVLPDGREEYAEHPYVTGEVNGFTVDLVPCYAVESATAIRSAVDRTPFHAAYLEEQLTPELATDARLAKQFLVAIGAYGSDLRTRGFSGYLVELLVIEHGGFVPLVRAAADWHPPVRFDPEGHGAAEFDDPLVVIDPTDPERNVAAVLSAENLARLQHHARALLAEPDPDRFEPDEPEPIDREAVHDHLDRRATVPVAVVFETPAVTEDELYPQLRRSLAGIGDELDRRGFDVLRRATFADDRAVLLFELAVATRPAVERHEGPPVHARGHAERFLDAYADSDAYGPFIDGDRYVVERGRGWTDAVALLRSEALLEMRLGARVRSVLGDGYEVLTGDRIAALADEFGVELARYFDPKP